MGRAGLLLRDARDHELGAGHRATWTPSGRLHRKEQPGGIPVSLGLGPHLSYRPVRQRTRNGRGLLTHVSPDRFFYLLKATFTSLEPQSIHSKLFPSDMHEGQR